MKAFDEAPRAGKRAAGLVIGVALAAAIALTPPAKAAPGIEALSQVDTVYVADPAALWFEEWTDANLKPHDWLYRPDIKIKAGKDLVAAVAANPSGIGLLTRGQLSRVQAGSGVPQIATAPTGLAVCAALSVEGARREASFGDFALNSDPIEVLATADTLAIAEALIDAYRFQGRMRVRQVEEAAAIAGISAGKPALAVLPVLPQARLLLPETAGYLRPIEMTEAAAEILRSRGLATQDYHTSFLQQIPLVDGVRTACDEIVLITAHERPIAPEAFTTTSSSWTDSLPGSDFAKRVRQALETLELLWRAVPEVKG